MKTEDLVVYKEMPVWHKDTIPAMFLEMHNTKEETYAGLKILQGELKFTYLNESGDEVSSVDLKPNDKEYIISPQQWHKVAPLTDDLEFQLKFLCRKQMYPAKKYNLSPAHSEVVKALEVVKPGKVLDLGCGGGRNSVYLALNGFTIDAVDRNQESLEFLKRITKQENFPITIKEYDINSASINSNYDFIVSTVVLMFCERQAIPQIIANMQEHTNPGGYNLIVAAMSTADYPCSMPFPFTFSEGELKDYYQGWEFIEYNENLGHLHKLDAQGNRIQLKFATMLARKPQG
ncbi:SAM-dependent methyltransferase TehB [Psittacicella gerlachiana]|uniref:Tellurite resistance methyltransferase TehB n=1 Tax=Psittacicella gerlachiana TaxID=2028574 RepID=A0A3A1YFH8_9GAMM|nr:SAM-dependent methyltransferase TehB [Psittacicella gerlachiana]RIY36196.1 tellurite resistance methyltransferase TehB [Psittacicella gerlachiana]